MGKRDLRRAILPIVWIFLISLLPAAACSPAHTTVSKSADFATSIARVRQEGVSVEIQWELSSNKFTLKNDDPKYAQLLDFISSSSIERTIYKQKPTVINSTPTTIHITVDHPYGYITRFKLKDSSTLRFDCAQENMWFQTEDAIYQASMSQEFYKFLTELNAW